MAGLQAPVARFTAGSAMDFAWHYDIDGVSFDTNLGVIVASDALKESELMEATYAHHMEASVLVNSRPETLFSFLDDQRNLSSHMEKSSWMMAGSKMQIELDQKEGKEVDSEIVLHGSIMGVPLYVREFITKREPPSRKIWETRGEQKLIVLDQYKMGFEIRPVGEASKLTVFIDYSLPKKGLSGVLGKAFGKTYARWCTNQMLKGATDHFA